MDFDEIFCRGVKRGPVINLLDFGGDHCPDPGFRSRIQQFLMNFLIKYLEGWGVVQKTVD